MESLKTYIYTHVQPHGKMTTILFNEKADLKRLLSYFYRYDKCVREGKKGSKNIKILIVIVSGCNYILFFLYINFSNKNSFL